VGETASFVARNLGTFDLVQAHHGFTDELHKNLAASSSVMRLSK